MSLPGAGQKLKELLQSREAAFDQRFADTFGQLSGQNTPAGKPLYPVLCENSCLEQRTAVCWLHEPAAD